MGGAVSLVGVIQYTQLAALLMDHIVAGKPWSKKMQKILDTEQSTFQAMMNNADNSYQTRHDLELTAQYRGEYKLLIWYI
jgi:ADP-glucose pyrophosphorylase